MANLHGNNAAWRGHDNGWDGHHERHTRLPRGMKDGNGSESPRSLNLQINEICRNVKKPWRSLEILESALPSATFCTVARERHHEEAGGDLPARFH
jgi:hypothetical protein